MILYIDNTIEEEFSRRNFTDPELLFFLRLADFHRRGKCKLCGEIHSLNRLCQSVSDPLNGVFRTILNHYAEQGAALKSVDMVFVLTCSNFAEKRILPQCIGEGIECCYIPLEYAMDWDFCPVALVAENGDDCAFYMAISEWHRSQKDLHGVCVNLSQKPGGGSTTHTMLELSVTDHKVLTLCIVDSDKKWDKSKEYPQEPAQGDTYLAVRRTSEKFKSDNYPPHCVQVVDAHEAENLIPLAVLAELEKQFPCIEPGLSKLRQLAIIDKGIPALCYDIKQGFRYLTKEQQIAYWKGIHINKLGGCIDDFPPKCNSKEEKFEVCAAFPPISLAHLLRRATKYISEHLNDINVDDYLLPIWEKIGRTILTWGYAERPYSA